MRLTTWNINSVRLRLNRVLEFLEAEQPDILCLQETKCLDDQFPAKAIKAAGYEHIALHGQKAYHGVATLSKRPFTDVLRETYCGIEDTRHVAVTLDDGVTVHNYYVPAGGDEPDPEVNPKFAHKLGFIEEMAARFDGAGDQSLILVGDLNIAPHENDVWSHKQLLKVVSHTPVEVAGLEKVRQAGDFIDVMRALTPDEEKLYTWWSYRAKDWRASNRGRRLDHVWVTPPLESRLKKKPGTGFKIHDDYRDGEKPSDHAPVTLYLK